MWNESKIRLGLPREILELTLLVIAGHERNKVLFSFVSHSLQIEKSLFSYNDSTLKTEHKSY